MEADRARFRERSGAASAVRAGTVSCFLARVCSCEPLVYARVKQVVRGRKLVAG